RGGSHHAPVTVAPLGVGRDRSGHQAAADDRCRGAYPGDGPTCGPSGGAGVGPWLCPLVSDRWVEGGSDGLADTLWAVGATTAPSGHRLRAEAALDALAPAALCASGQDRAAPSSGAGAAPGRVRHA